METIPRWHIDLMFEAIGHIKTQYLARHRYNISTAEAMYVFATAFRRMAGDFDNHELNRLVDELTSTMTFEPAP